MLLFLFLFFTSYGISYYFNYRTTKKINKQFALLALIDTVGVTSVLYLTFLNGTISRMLFFWPILLFAFGAIYIRMYHTEFQYDNHDVVLEPMKNTFVLQVRTTILFIIGLTIFKYLPVFQAIIYSFGIVIVGFGLYFVAQKIRDYIGKKLQIQWSFNGAMEVFVPILIVVITVVIMVLFNLPWNRLNTNLNLNPYKPTYSFIQSEPYELDYHYDLTIQNRDQVQAQNSIVFENDPSLYLLSNVEDFIVFYNNTNTDEYYAYYDTLSEMTYYFKNGEEVLSTSGRAGTTGIVIGNRIYVTDGFEQDIADILVYDLDMIFVERIMSLPMLSFYEPSTERFITNGFQVDDDTLKIYYQEESTSNQRSYSLSVQYKDTVMDYSFYQYFSFFYIYVTVLVLFVRVSDYRKHVTTIAFDTEIKKEKAFG